MIFKKYKEQKQSFTREYRHLVWNNTRWHGMHKGIPFHLSPLEWEMGSVTYRKCFRKPGWFTEQCWLRHLSSPSPFNRRLDVLVQPHPKL